jgi:hypothetical protein
VGEKTNADPRRETGVTKPSLAGSNQASQAEGAGERLLPHDTKSTKSTKSTKIPGSGLGCTLALAFAWRLGSCQALSWYLVTRDLAVNFFLGSAVSAHWLGEPTRCELFLVERDVIYRSLGNSRKRQQTRHVSHVGGFFTFYHGYHAFFMLKIAEKYSTLLHDAGITGAFSTGFFLETPCHYHDVTRPCMLVW